MKKTKTKTTIEILTAKLADATVIRDSVSLETKARQRPEAKARLKESALVADVMKIRADARKALMDICREADAAAADLTLPNKLDYLGVDPILSELQPVPPAVGGTPVPGLEDMVSASAAKRRKIIEANTQLELLSETRKLRIAGELSRLSTADLVRRGQAAAMSGNLLELKMVADEARSAFRLSNNPEQKSKMVRDVDRIIEGVTVPEYEADRNQTNEAIELHERIRRISAEVNDEREDVKPLVDGIRKDGLDQWLDMREKATERSRQASLARALELATVVTENPDA